MFIVGQSGWRARIQKKRMIKKPVKTKKSKMEPKVKNQEKTPKLEHGKTNKINPIRPTLVIGILGCMVVLLRLELGKYLEAGSDFMENDTLAGILENSTQPRPGGNDFRVLDREEYSGQNQVPSQCQFLLNFKYRRKQVLSLRLDNLGEITALEKVLSLKLNKTFGDLKIRN